MSATSLPLWVQILSALFTPMIAIIAGIIAFLQWRTAERKRRMDLFDKRYALYKKLQEYLDKVINWQPDDADYDWSAFIYSVDELPFIFGNWAFDYRSEIFDAFFGFQRYIIDIENHKEVDDEDLQAARDRLAKMLLGMPQTFWKDMRLS